MRLKVDDKCRMPRKILENTYDPARGTLLMELQFIGLQNVLQEIRSCAKMPLLPLACLRCSFESQSM